MIQSCLSLCCCRLLCVMRFPPCGPTICFFGLSLVNDTFERPYHCMVYVSGTLRYSPYSALEAQRSQSNKALLVGSMEIIHQPAATERKTRLRAVSYCRAHLWFTRRSEVDIPSESEHMAKALRRRDLLENWILRWSASLLNRGVRICLSLRISRGILCPA